MNKYGGVARSAAVVLGCLIAAQGVLPNGLLFRSRELHEISSDHLLNDSESPFQQLKDGPEQERNSLALSVPSVVSRVFHHVVRKGATFASVWKDLGGEASDTSAAADALKKAGVSPGQLKGGESLAVTERDGQVVEVRKKLAEGAHAVLVRNDDGSFSSRVEKPKTSMREKRVSGVITSSLVDSASGVALPYSLVDDFVDLFSNRVEFRRDIQPGDSFTVIYEEKVTEGGEVVTEPAIKGASLQLSGKVLAVVRDVARDGTVRYFDEKGEMPSKAFLRYPVKFSRISSVFTNARFHPVLKISRPHHGVDFAAPVGTPVRTVGDGRVVFSGYTPSTGYMVRVAHDSRYTTEYMHLNSISKGAGKGARIARGDVIGTLGNTGLSTGPHLHFGLFDKGKYIDPMKAKVIQSGPPIRPSAAVLALLSDLKRSHDTVALESSAVVAKVRGARKKV